MQKYIKIQHLDSTDLALLMLISPEVKLNPSGEYICIESDDSRQLCVSMLDLPDSPLEELDLEDILVDAVSNREIDLDIHDIANNMRKINEKMKGLLDLSFEGSVIKNQVAKV